MGSTRMYGGEVEPSANLGSFSHLCLWNCRKGPSFLAELDPHWLDNEVLRPSRTPLARHVVRPIALGRFILVNLGKVRRLKSRSYVRRAVRTLDKPG